MHNQHLIDEMTERLKELKPLKVILFGSYARGNPVSLALHEIHKKIALSRLLTNRGEITIL